MDVFPTVRAFFFLKTSFGLAPVWVFRARTVPPLMLVYTLACHLLFAITTRSSCFELGLRCTMSTFLALGMASTVTPTVLASGHGHAPVLAHLLRDAVLILEVMDADGSIGGNSVGGDCLDWAGGCCWAASTSTASPTEPCAHP